MTATARPSGTLTSELLTVDEAALALRMSRMAVYRLATSGELASIRIGRALRVPSAALRGRIGVAR